MRIVNLETFRALPEWTMFAKYRPAYCENPQFKGETWEYDFVCMSFDMPENNGSEQLFDRLTEMEETGVSYPMEADGWGRDGLFEKEQLFMIYEEGDLRSLRQMIDLSLAALTSHTDTPTSQPQTEPHNPDHS